MLNLERTLIVFILGLTSGFTLMISGNTLNYWLSIEGIDIRTIGLFSIICIPYSINFLWSPIFDIKKVPILYKLLGHRLSWIVLLQFLLGITVFLISLISPTNNIYYFGFLGLLISIFSSAKDTVLGALRSEILDVKAQATTSGIYIFGYRIGMLLSSSFAIYLSVIVGWNNIYLLFSISIYLLSFILIIILNKYIKNKSPLNYQLIQDDINNKYQYQSIFIFIQNIIKPIGSWYYIFIILLFLILYRLPDNFINAMINPFLIYLQYDSLEIASLGKLFGVTTAIIGGLIASYIMKYYDIRKSLLIFGVLHAIAHSLFILQIIVGKNLIVLSIVIGFESITGGMTMAAYIGFISSLCSGKFRATQYSFLSSMMGLSRSILPSISGYLVYEYGWQVFFITMVLMTIPSLILSYKLVNILKKEDT